MNHILALDTCTESCSAALFSNGALQSLFAVCPREHTQRLHPMCQQLLAEAGLSFAQLDGVVCVNGPGAFTGVRIGVSVAQAMAVAHDIPACGVSSLVCLAREYAEGVEAGAQVVSALDARMGEVYAALWQVGPGHKLTERLAPAVLTAEQLLPGLPEGIDCVGSGYAPWAEVFARKGIRQAGDIRYPRAEFALRYVLENPDGINWRDAAELQPVYLRNKVAG